LSRPFAEAAAETYALMAGYRYLEDDASSFGLTAPLCRLDGGQADVVEYLGQQLARYGRALHISVSAHLLRYAESFLR